MSKKNDFAEMLARMAGGDDEESRPSLSTEKQVEILREMAARYATPASQRFAIGDLVTPTDRTPVKGKGNAHVVVELRDRNEDDGAIDTSIRPGADRVHMGSNSYGVQLDMRIICIGNDGDIGSFWVESWTFESWVPKAA